MLQTYLQFLMLHACFVCIPTCFMCTLIKYLAFLGTNLLTRCHSASSHFLLFFCFRKVLHEIFSELHRTKNPVSYNFITKPQLEGETKWGPPGSQTLGRRG